jgi:GH24 family phage-related lysozyme (muramidase)
MNHVERVEYERVADWLLLMHSQLTPGSNLKSVRFGVYRELNNEFGLTGRVRARAFANVFKHALVSFCYNLGAGSLKKSTLLKKVNADPNDPSIKLEFLKWNKSGGKVLNGLTLRRNAESELYFKI